jgi:hypothetical protein
LTWNIFDDEYRKKLDTRSYVSPSRDERLGVESASREFPAQTPAPAVNGNGEPRTTKETGAHFDDDQDLEFDEAPSDEEDDAEIPEGSLFDYEIPGVLTKAEVQNLDLDHWRLVVRNTLIELEVYKLRFAYNRYASDRLLTSSVGLERLGRLAT